MARLSLATMALIATALTVTLSACGSTSIQDYADDYQPISQDLARLYPQVTIGFNTAKGKTSLQIQDEFGGYADQLAKIGTRLDDLSPPDELKDESGELKAAIDLVVNDLRQVTEAARTNNVSRARAGTEAFVQDSPRVSQARAKLDRASGVSRS
jgi:hypothetical protein